MGSTCMALQLTLRSCLHTTSSTRRNRTCGTVTPRTRQCPTGRQLRAQAASVRALRPKLVESDVGVAEPLEEPAALAEEAPAEAEASGSAPADAEAASSFALNFLWLEKNIAVAVDHVISESQRSPLTEFFFWPRKDAWEELKSALESKPWVSERDKVLLLNKTTEVINFWQDEEQKHSIAEAQERFPDCKFSGA